MVMGKRVALFDIFNLDREHPNGYEYRGFNNEFA